MSLHKGLICLGVVGQLAWFAGAALAQDYAQPVAINTLSRVSGGPAPGAQSPSLQGTDEGMPAPPARDSSRRRRRTEVASSVITADTDTTTIRRLPRTGGDPLTLAGAGFLLVSAGGVLRRRVGRRTV